MILVRREGFEEKLSYEQFIREIQEGRIQVDTMIWSDVLTSGVWKPAGDLQFFRSWAPKGSVFTSAVPRPRPDDPPSLLPPVHAAEPGAGRTASGEAGPEFPPEPSGAGPEESDRGEGSGAGTEKPGPGTSTEPPTTGGSAPGPWIPYGHGPEAPPAIGPPRPAPGVDEGGIGGTGTEPGGFGWGRSFSGDIPTGPPLPWEEMDKHGFFRAAGRTIHLALANPEEFFRCIGRGRGIMPALVFGLTFLAFAAVVQSLYTFAILRLFPDMIANLQEMYPKLLPPGSEPGLGEDLLMLGIFVLVYPVAAFLGAGLIHSILRTFGRPVRDFQTTFRMVNYAVVVVVFVLIPSCGNVIAPAWFVVLLTRGLSRLHRMRSIVVLAAVLLPGVILMCLWVQAMLLAGVMQGVSGLGLRS